MDSVTQDKALDLESLAPRERARFFRRARHDQLDCLTATFRRHKYPLHSHETYVIGVITAGCEVYRIGRGYGRAGAGDICFVDPGVMHDGGPEGEGYAYRMSYPSIALISGIAADITDGRHRGTPSFRQSIVRDREAADLFIAAHRRLETDIDPLAGDEMLARAYAKLLARHAAIAPADLKGSAPAIARVRDYLDARYAEPVGLAELAAIAGLSRFHLVRAFKQEVGLTPHAYLTDCRVRAARRLLVEGHAPAQVAGDCGFFDQSHLTRVFKARIGVTPGAFRSAAA